MNHRHLFSFILFITFVSCNKDQTLESPNEENQLSSDQFIPEVTASILKNTLHHDCHDNSFTLAEKYTASNEFRFREGVQIGDMYLYTIEKRFIERFVSQTGVETSWSDTNSWLQLNSYYRYSFDENKSYLYSSINDTNPTLLFDYNVNIGDTINLSSFIPNSNHLAEVLGVTNVMINNQNFPIINCKWVSCSNCFFEVSPDLPNPFAFEDSTINLELNNAANIPGCSQTMGPYYSRGGKNHLGQWTYY